MKSNAPLPPRASDAHTYEETDDDRLWRTCLHEASHSVVALACDVDVDLVSVRPGQAHAGIAFPDVPTWHGDADEQAATPGPFVDSELRRVLELRAVIALAGDIAERMAPPPEPGYRPESEDRIEAERHVRTLADLSPRHVELLSKAEAQTAAEKVDDRELAEKAAGGMGTGEEKHAHLAWLEVVARNLVHRSAREIVAVAEELYRRRVLTGDEVRAAMRRAYPPIRRSA